MSLESVDNWIFDENNFIEKVNKSIFDWSLSNIIEVTYAYEDLWNWKHLNKTLFEVLIWEKYENNISYLNWRVTMELYSKKDLVNSFIDFLNSQSNLSEKMLILKWT